MGRRTGHGWQPPGGDWSKAKCSQCRRLMRPSSARAGDWPGTVQHVGRGGCYRCRRQIKQAAVQDQARTQAVANELAYYLRSRGRVDPELPTTTTAATESFFKDRPEAHGSLPLPLRACRVPTPLQPKGHNERTTQ